MASAFDANSQLQAMANKSPQSPFVKIVEQPARCALRFRYECEGRSAGSIPGANTTADNKTYPSIQVLNYKGPAVVVVSCVTKEMPYRPHPHNLVGKEGCKKGVCTMVISNPEMICSFTSLGIQCVKRKDVEESLKLRESIKVDPFRTGFAHKSQASNIDLNVVRLCFQVFIEGPEKDKFTVPLAPVVCEPIYDKKAMSELIITKLSHCSAPVTGGKEMILLCDRVTKDDVQVRFYEERNGQLVWEAFAEFQPNDVHKQVAICFRTPRYFDETIQQPVLVQLQLRRPSDMQASDSRPFQFLPREVDPDGLTRKRQKLEEVSFDRYLRESSLLPNVLNVNKSPSPATSPAMEVSGQEQPMAMQNVPANEFIGIPRLSVKVKSELPDISGDLGATAWPMAKAPIQASQHQLTQMLPPSSSFHFNSQMVFASSSTHTHNHHNEQQAGAAQAVKREYSDAAAKAAVLGHAMATFGSQPGASSAGSRAFNNSAVEGALSEKLDSLDLDIDPSDLMNDINFNNLMVMMDSGNNITFNSSGNIADASGVTPGSLHTPQMLDVGDNSKNPMASSAQMARLHNELQSMQNQLGKGNHSSK